MTKKMISWLSVLTVFLSIYSCRQEDLLTHHDEDISKTITVQQLLKADLAKIPYLQGKISQLENKLPAKSSPNGKIYTDNEEWFSVDTEKALYIEDAKGNKTYTFRIIRTDASGALENLILQDIGNSEFEAYIATYDEVAVQNYKSLSLEELKAHVKMVAIGKRNTADIFGKSNANACQITTISNVYEVYVPGTMCSENKHNYSGYWDCTAPVKPTEGYYTSVTEYTTVNTCEGGESSTGDGTINTGPYGGYIGGGGLPDLNSPCGKIAQLFLQQSFIDKYNEMTQPSVFNLNHEKVYAVKYPNPGSGSTEPEYINADLPDCASDGNQPIVKDPMVYGLIHDHQNQSCNPDDLPPGKFPSHIDIKTFINDLMPHAMTNTGSYANAYSLITTSGGNYMLMYSGTNNPGSINSNQLEILRKEYIKFLLRAYDKSNYDQKDVEAELLRFIKDKINKPGLEVYRVTSNSATKIEYNFSSPNRIKEIPCN